MKKQKRYEVRYSNFQNTEIKWKDLKDLPFEDEWLVDIELDDSDNGSRYVYGIRAYELVEESDEEYEARMAEIKRIQDNTLGITAKQRYENYLKLREEFEPGPILKS